MTGFGLAPGSISLAGLSKAMTRVPDAMWRAYASAVERSMRGWWRDHFKRNSKMRFGRGRHNLGNPKRWPFKITAEPTNPVDWSRFRATVGNYDIEGRPSAAPVLEYGATLTPTRRDDMVIPLRKSAKGNRGQSYFARKKRGVKFVRLVRNGHTYLHALIKERGAQRGRPRKGARKARMVPERQPSYLLVRRTTHRPGILGFHSSWKRALPDTRRRMAETLRPCVAAALAGKPVPIPRPPSRGTP